MGTCGTGLRELRRFQDRAADQHAISSRAVVMEDSMAQLLDVLKFRERCDPIRDNCWGLDCPITQNDVITAVLASRLIPPGSDRDSRSDHVARIAWFVIHGWNDPIHIDVGVPSLGCYPSWPLEDGNHRFAAAVIRGDLAALANMSGAVGEIQDFLLPPQPADIPDLARQ